MTPRTRVRLVTAAVGLAITVLAQAPAGASTSLTLSGSGSDATQKSRLTNCASGADECGTLSLDGLGAADWNYVFGPTLTPVGKCYQDDGTFTLTLQADHSSITGSLTGLFCPKFSTSSMGADNSYGNPFVEDDTIAFTSGTGQFAGLEGTAVFHTFSAGARTRVALQGSVG